MPRRWRGEQVGRLIRNGGVGVPPPGGGNRAWRDIEGHRIETEPGDELSVIAGPAAHDESAIALDSWGIIPLGDTIGQVFRPRYEERVRCAAIPGHDGLARRGGRVHALEPGCRVAGRDGLLGQPACELFRILRLRHTLDGNDGRMTWTPR